MGEILDATRSDLVLASDVAPGIHYALLCLKEPKTRGRGPRHQNARIEPKDIVDLLTGVLGDYNPADKLWKFSVAKDVSFSFCIQLVSKGSWVRKAENMIWGLSVQEGQLIF